MGAARDLFRQVGWAVHGNPDAYETRCKAAELWRAEDSHSAPVWQCFVPSMQRGADRKSC